MPGWSSHGEFCAWAAATRQPAAVIYGDADGVTPLLPSSKALMQNLGRAKLTVVEGASHQVEISVTVVPPENVFGCWCCGGMSPGQRSLIWGSSLSWSCSISWAGPATSDKWMDVGALRMCIRDCPCSRLTQDTSLSEGFNNWGRPTNER